MTEQPRDFNQRSNQELLELLLRSGDRAEEILKEVPLEKLDQAHRRELKLTPKAYERLQVSIELGRRIQESKTKFRVIAKIGSSDEAIAFCQRHFSRLVTDCLQEEFHVVTLDTKNIVVDSHQVTVGTLDASLVLPPCDQGCSLFDNSCSQSSLRRPHTKPRGHCRHRSVNRRRQNSRDRRVGPYRARKREMHQRSRVQVGRGCTTFSFWLTHPKPSS
jgi:hypothetical protein